MTEQDEALECDEVPETRRCIFCQKQGAMRNDDACEECAREIERTNASGYEF